MISKFIEITKDLEKNTMNIEQEDSLDKEDSRIQVKREETRRELAKVIKRIQDGI